MVVPCHRQHTTVARCAKCIGMLDHIHAAINPRPLAIPHAEHAIVTRAGKQVGLLAAPDRSRREIFVQPRLKMNIVTLEPGFCFPHGLVNATHGGAAIAGYKARRIEPGAAIALLLQHRQPDQRFNPGHVGARRVEGVLVVQRYFSESVAVVGCHNHCSCTDLRFCARRRGFVI